MSMWWLIYPVLGACAGLLAGLLGVGGGLVIVAALAWLLPLLEAALMPTEPDDDAPFAQHAAATLLLARYHRQRMPLRLLVPHLWHKLRPSRAAGRQKAEEATPV